MKEPTVKDAVEEAIEEIERLMAALEQIEHDTYEENTADYARVNRENAEGILEQLYQFIDSTEPAQADKGGLNHE